MNVPGWTEAADDPYNAYEANNWNDVSNYLQKDDLESIVPNNLVFYDLLIGPADWTAADFSWTSYGSCIPEPSPSNDHPYKVVFDSSSGGLDTFSIITGSTNNVIPGNIASTITVSSGSYDVWIEASLPLAKLPRRGWLRVGHRYACTVRHRRRRLYPHRYGQRLDRHADCHRLAVG